MNSPLVSICIPSYNQARYLRSAIESALSQTYDNIEVIVVDDGSTDDSLEVAQRYEASHPDSVKVFRHDDGSNKGVSATINVGITQSRGTYWCVMGADDVFQRHKTKRQVGFLEKNAEVSFVYSRTDIINGSGDLVEGAMGRDVTRTSDPIERMLCWNAIPASTVMVRRNGVRTASLLHDETLLHSDWELWIRLMANGEVGFIDEALVLYRVHGGNISVTIDPVVNLEHCLSVMTSLREKAVEVGGRLRERRLRALIELQRSFFLFGLGRRDEAVSALKAGFDVDHTLKQDGSYIARWLNGREREFTRFVVTTLKNEGLVSVSSLISPWWVYVRSKPIVKSLLGSSITDRVAGAKRHTQNLLRVK